MGSVRRSPQKEELSSGVLDGRQQRDESFEECQRSDRSRGGFSSCDEFTQCWGGGGTVTCDFVDFALVNYLSVHAYHHFYM